MELVAPLTAPNRLVDTVYERLREAILTGEIEPGEKLSVPALAQKLAVSRSPIVAAVQRLTQDGLAVEEPRRGAVVTIISVPELIRLYEIREVLEGLAARLAAERATEENIAGMAAVLERHEAAVNPDDQQTRMLENVNFHRLIRDAAQHPELVKWLEAIQSQSSSPCAAPGSTRMTWNSLFESTARFFRQSATATATPRKGLRAPILDAFARSSNSLSKNNWRAPPESPESG